ncbi:hypothetical protein CEXT_546501, partial [Caerostris extrusa]
AGTEDISERLLNAHRAPERDGCRFPAEESGVDARHRVLLRRIAHRPTARKDMKIGDIKASL